MKKIYNLPFAVCVLSFLSFAVCHAAQLPEYEINANIDTAAHTIKAHQTVTYTNNSDSQLQEIYFHIYPNRRYTKSEIRFIYRYAGYFKIDPFPEGFQSGSLSLDSVASGGDSLKFVIEGEDRTILKVILNSALKPGDSVKIDMDFKVKVPHAYGRFGWHKDIMSLVRWYPILSVFDKQGWHNYPFYIYHLPHFSEASSYKLKLTLPADQKVASSGFLKGEVINPDGTKTMEIETDFPVRDFSLGISNSFEVYSLDAGKTRVNAYYLKGDADKARSAAEDARDLMKFYGERFGEYPYRDFNIVPSFLGYGGVQSSAQVFIDTRVYKLPGFLHRYFDFLVSHETGHQWFYNLIGCDEYKEMFLDEGVNSYWILQYLESKYGKGAQVMDLPRPLQWLVPNFSFRDSAIARYLYIAKNDLDAPVIRELSSFQEPSSIFAITYGKGQAILDMLEALIGQEDFLKIWQPYAEELRFKNISLEEFIQTCSKGSGRDLSWFFDEWLKTRESCDYAIKSVTPDAVTLENRGKIIMPVKIKLAYEDGTQVFDSWDGKEKLRTIPIPENKKILSVAVDPDDAIVLDIDRTNNYWPRNLYVRPVPLYFFAYEIPVFLPRNSYNLVVGPSVGGSSLGIGSSFQKPYDYLLKISADYDFNGKAVKSVLGYELRHLFNKQLALGFEAFDYEASRESLDLSGGKIYLRQELWPANYGLFDINDHVTFYFLKDRKFDSTVSSTGNESKTELYYRRKKEAIFGITGSLGRYGPYPDPDYGWKFMPTVEYAGRFLGGNYSFWRTTMELDNYRMILPKYQHKLAGRIKFGWGNPGGKKLFQLGGAEDFRGFDLKSIEGSRMMLGSLEYRFPLKSDIRLCFLDNIIYLDKIQAVGFFDIGKVWNSDFGSAAYKKDAGLGLRLHFNIAGFLEKIVLRFDVAQAINAPKEEPHYWVGISHTF